MPIKDMLIYEPLLSRVLADVLLASFLFVIFSFSLILTRENYNLNLILTSLAFVKHF